MRRLAEVRSLTRCNRGASHETCLYNAWLRIAGRLWRRIFTLSSGCEPERDRGSQQFATSQHDTNAFTDSDALTNAFAVADSYSNSYSNSYSYSNTDAGCAVAWCAERQSKQRTDLWRRIR